VDWTISCVISCPRTAAMRAARSAASLAATAPSVGSVRKGTIQHAAAGLAGAEVTGLKSPASV
jgi:hypothetical protein